MPNELLKIVAILMFIAWMVTLPSAFASPWFGSHASASPLDLAHQAFLEGSFLSMAKNLKDSFQDKNSDPLVKKNALALLEKAYEVRGGQIPTDWKLPSEVKRMDFAIRRHHDADGESFSVKLSGTVNARGLFKQIRVTRFPSVVLLDKEKSIGTWEPESPLSDGQKFQFLGAKTSEPAAEGLYFLDLELVSGEVTHGWFLVSNLLPSETPVVHVPAVGQTFHSASPTMRWDDFHSPEYRGFERRAIWIATYRTDGPKSENGEWDESWDYFNDDPVITEATIGQGGKGLEKLKNGRYVFLVAYRENRQFGDLTLRRQAITSRPFYVRCQSPGGPKR